MKDMTPEEIKISEPAWKSLSQELESSEILHKSVKELVALTGMKNLTDRARVRVAEQFREHRISYSPMDALTEKDHGDQMYIIVISENSEIAKIAKYLAEPSPSGARGLKSAEAIMQRGKKTGRRLNAISVTTGSLHFQSR